MSGPDYVVDTVEKARGLSLIKWDKCEKLTEDLFDEIDRSCGFCDLGRSRAESRGVEYVGLGCHDCEVYDRCQEIQSESSYIESRLRTLIKNTQKFLKDMDVRS